MRNILLDENIGKFCEAIDIGFQVDFVKEYEKIGDSDLYGGKHCGSDAEHRGSEFIAGKLKEIGVSNVELVPCETARYQFNDSTMTVEGESRVLKPYGYVSPGTTGAGITACLTDIGKATKEECDAVDLEGKIAMFAAMGTLEGASLSGQIEQAIKNGAAALVIYAVEDVLNDETIRVQPPNIVSTVPIVGICEKDAEWLKKKTTEGKCIATLKVDAEFDPHGGITYNVVGEIPGRVSDERIIYTAHLDHYFRCLQDNMSTCSTLLGIAKAIIDSGYEPNRTITFAFHGSHETGGSDTRYPYIYGSYKLTHESKPEWVGKAIANINFEYTALKMKKLQVVAYVGVNSIPIGYYDYSPELTGAGFETKEQYSPQTEYYMLSWSDCISYHTAGIPTMCNDPISEQFYEGIGPYVGRDHSNFDNWEIFDENILEDVGRFYGGMGLYLDAFPYMSLDFTEQADRIRNEVDRAALDVMEVSHDRYFEAVDRLEDAAKRINAFIATKNDEYVKALTEGMTFEEIRRWYERGHESNELMLQAYKLVADEMDRINAYDFMCLATVKYMQNTAVLSVVKDALEKGDAQKAFEALVPLDLAAASYYFQEDVAEHMRKQICAPEYINRRTWAAGRELNIFTYYDLVQSFKKETESGEGYPETIKIIEKAIETESGYIPESMENEIGCINKIIKILNKEQIG